MAITKRVHYLADGRELIYFDDANTRLSPDRAPDLRLLDQRPATATMRQDPLTGEWISIATARQNRVVMPSAALDPLAPQTPDNPSEIPSNYDVVVFENRSPSFGPALPTAGGPVPPATNSLPESVDGLLESVDGPSGSVGSHPESVESAQNTAQKPQESSWYGVALKRSLPSFGRCEVVCFSPAHEGAFGSIDRSRARTVIEAWADRTATLSALPGVKQVFPFENRGDAVGVTLQHPHGQIFAYPYITPRTQRLIDSINTYGAGLFADILASEQDDDRVVLAGEHWTAFVPFAARWPIEVHMLPNRHVADFAATDDSQRDELAVLYLRLLRALDALYPDPTPYIAAWHQAPVHSHRDSIRLNLQLTSPRRAADKLKFLAGSESAMGAWIGDIPPETQAEQLRAALKRSDRDNPA